MVISYFNHSNIMNEYVLIWFRIDQIMKSTDSCKKTRVTISIPQEAGENLKQLARFNTQLLNDLGILSVQIDGAKPVVVDAMQNTECPDAQTKSFAAASWKSNDLISGCWRPVENIYSQVTPVLDQIQKHSRDLLMVPYRECLSPASANLCMPNGRFNSCHNTVLTPKPKIPKAANSPLCSSKPQFLSLAMSQMSSYFDDGYHPPELPGTGIVASIHGDPISNSLAIGCNDPLDAVFEPSHAKVRPRRQRKKALRTVEKLREEVDQTFVPAAEVVKVCLPTKTLGSNNVLPVTRLFHLDNNMGCVTKPALPGMVSKTHESAIVTTDSLSHTVVSECKLNYAVGSSKLSAKFEISRLDLNSPDKTHLKLSCTAPTCDTAFLVDAGRSCNINLASEDEERMPKLPSSLSDGCLSSPYSPRSLACGLSEDDKFSCPIPELCHDKSKKNEAETEPCGNASCGIPPCAASPSSANFHLNEKSGFLETVSSNVELFSSGDAVSESSTIEMALLSCNESEVNSLQTSSVHQPYPQAAIMLGCAEKDSSLGLCETCCARKLDLTEQKSGSHEPPVDFQVSAEMKKLSGPISADHSRSAVDAQLKDLNSFSQMDELNSDLNTGRSEELAANELDKGSTEKVTMPLDKDLSCVTSRQLNAWQDADDVEILLPLALQSSSDDCTVMEELSNLPREKTEPLLEEFQQFQCVLAADASEWISETRQLPEASVDMILANDVSCVATANVNQDGGLKFPINSPVIDAFAESSCVADFATVPLVAATLTPLLTSEPNQDTMQRITGISSKENEPISLFNRSQESVDTVLDSNLTDRNLIQKPSQNGYQVGLRGKRSNDTDPVCLDWSGLSDEDIKVIKLNNRHSALDLHSPRFEELSVCSTKALSDDLRQLNALVVCEFDSLAVKASSLLCVTKLTDGAQSKKVRIVKSTEMSGNLRTKRKRNGHFSILEKRRMKRKIDRDVPVLNKDHSYLSSGRYYS